MANGYLKKTTLGLSILMIALGVSACGRKGALEAPPSAQLATSDTEENSAAPEKPDNPFFLDPLI